MRSTVLLLTFLAAVPAGAAELYRWVDENGTVNYSNTPPPKTHQGKPATVVEDRLSVYTPEKSVTDAIERKRREPPPSASFAREPALDRRATLAPPPPPPPPVGYDPCLNPNDLNCPGFLYDGSPVFHGRRRHPPLVQPQIPPGTIAGQAAGPKSIIPGQSGTALPPPAPQSRSPGRGHDREREPQASRR